MAFEPRPKRKLNRLEQDLRDYATNKVYNLMRDVVQSFEIAKLSKDHAAACLGSIFLRLSAALAVEPEEPLSKEKFMQLAEECYDGAADLKKQIP